jgi:rubredoxin
MDRSMICPHCSAQTDDVTENWHTFTEAEGAEYLATYVTIWHCSVCETVVGAQNGGIEWVMEPQEALSED